MPSGLYISAEGAMAQSLRLDTISNNLANVDSTGFKRDLAIFQARHAEEIARGDEHHGSGSIRDVGGGVNVLETRTDFSIGPLKSTGIPTDMAIRGEGFFTVGKDGRTFLTRAGNFSITADGALVTQDGYPVLDEEGSPVTIDPNLGPWSVSSTGEVQQQGSATNLGLVRPDSLGDLVKAGESLFAPIPGVRVQPLALEERSVASGFLEQSGVKAIQEMTQMIETSRAFEANVNMIKHQDQMLGSLVSRVLKS